MKKSKVIYQHKEYNLNQVSIKAKSTLVHLGVDLRLWIFPLSVLCDIIWCSVLFWSPGQPGRKTNNFVNTNVSLKWILSDFEQDLWLWAVCHLFWPISHTLLLLIRYGFLLFLRLRDNSVNVNVLINISRSLFFWELPVLK